MSCASLQNSYVNTIGGSAPPIEGSYITWEMPNIGEESTTDLIVPSPRTITNVAQDAVLIKLIRVKSTPTVVISQVQIKTTDGTGGAITANIEVDALPVTTFVTNQTTVFDSGAKTVAGDYLLTIVTVIGEGYLLPNATVGIKVRCATAPTADSMTVVSASITAITQG